MAILVVIDGVVQRSSQMAYALRSLGKVHEARAPQEIQTILDREGKIDAFVVAADLGPGVVKKLRDLYRYPVFVYGDLSPGAVAEMYAAGAEDLFPYPLDPAWLEDRLRRLAEVRPVSFPDAGEPRKAQSKGARSSDRTERPLDLPDPEDAYADVPLKGEEPSRSLNRFVIVCSVKGGEGKTSFLAQLGMVLARKGLRTVLLDADPTGNVAQWVKADVVDDISEFGTRRSFSERDLETMLVDHRPSGLKVLPSPLSSAEPLRWEVVRAAVDAYRSLYPLVMVDLPGGFSPALMHLARDYATDVFLLVSPDASRLQRSRRMLDLLIQLGTPPHKLRVIVNQVKKEAHFQVVRAALSEVSPDVTIYSLPYHPELDNPDRTGIAPIVLSDSKSAYGKAFRRILSEVFRVKAVLPDEDVREKTGAKRVKVGGLKALFGLLAGLGGGR